MAQVLIVALYAFAGSLIWFGARLEMSNEVRLAFNIVGGIGSLVLPIFVYSAIDLRLTRNAIERTGRSWCADGGVQFVRTKIHKNHFSLVYNGTQEGMRQKFRVRIVPTTWVVRAVEWI